MFSQRQISYVTYSQIEVTNRVDMRSKGGEACEKNAELIYSTCSSILFKKHNIQRYSDKE